MFSFFILLYSLIISLLSNPYLISKFSFVFPLFISLLFNNFLLLVDIFLHSLSFVLFKFVYILILLSRSLIDLCSLAINSLLSFIKELYFTELFKLFNLFDNFLYLCVLSSTIKFISFKLLFNPFLFFFLPTLILLYSLLTNKLSIEFNESNLFLSLVFLLSIFEFNI